MCCKFRNVIQLMFRIIAFFINTLPSRIYVGIGLLITCGKHLNDGIISLKGGVWDHQTSLIPPLCIEVPVLSTESKRSCICVLMISILHLFTIFRLNFGTFFRQCGIISSITFDMIRYLTVLWNLYAYKLLFYLSYSSFKNLYVIFHTFHRKRVESKIRLIKKFNAATEHTAES